MIPEILDKWEIETIDRLVCLRDIESEGFDFKGPEFKQLSNHICAMANTSGGYLVLGIGEKKNPENSYFIGFEKKGFVLGKEQEIEIEINNARINVEPDPSMAYRNIEDKDNKFYPVIKIENINDNKPYFVKGSGICYIRAGKSTTPASRSMVLNLLSNHIQRKNSILRLMAACRDLIEQIRYTCNDIETADPKDGSTTIKPLNLYFLQNSVLDTEWFFLKNKLYGGHIDENTTVEGYYSFYNELERLNLAINTFNQPINPFNQQFFFDQRAKIKNNEMRFWNPSESNAKKNISFLNHIITLCHKFEKN